LLSSHPGYFGKVGMRHFHLKKNHKYCPTINLNEVWSLVTEQQRKAYANRKDKAVVIDVTHAGYFKVLGKGRLPKQPVIVKAKSISKKAEEKIKRVGGQVLLTA
jgi:large subunit ribosomal protein L27Ae